MGDYTEPRDMTDDELDAWIAHHRRMLIAWRLVWPVGPALALGILAIVASCS